MTENKTKSLAGKQLGSKVRYIMVCAVLLATITLTYVIRTAVVGTNLVSTLAGDTRGFADGPSAVAEFLNPTGVAVDASGNVYVADASNHRIRKIQQR